MPKLTDAWVRNIKVEKRQEFSDDGCVGLRLRVSPTDNSKTFYFFGRPAGSSKVERIKLGSPPAMTVTEARVHANRVRAGQKTGQAKRGQEPTFGDAADAYVQSIEGRKKTWAVDKANLQRPLARWRDTPIRSLRLPDFVKFLSEIAQAAPVSANRIQATLRTMMGRAVELGLIDANPLAGARKQGGAETPKTRVLTDAEIAAFLDHLEDPESPRDPSVDRALRLMFLTAARPVEVAEMRLDQLIDLDGADPVWLLPQPKNKRPHIIPLSAPAVAIIKAAIADLPKVEGVECAFVFASRYDPRKPVERHSLSHAVSRSILKQNRPASERPKNIQKFTPHDIRRTTATLAQAAGIPREHVKALLNHIDRDVTAVYARYDMRAEKRAAVEAIATRIERIREAARAKKDA